MLSLPPTAASHLLDFLHASHKVSCLIQVRYELPKASAILKQMEKIIE